MTEGMPGTASRSGDKDSSGEEAFRNTDNYLKQVLPRILKERRAAGLEGLVGGLEAIIINTEEEHFRGAIGEILRTTGFFVAEAFEDRSGKTVVLSSPGSADIILQSRYRPHPVFTPLNRFPGAVGLPHTRLETLVLSTIELDTYVEIQEGRGVSFLTGIPVRGRSFSFIQTNPSPFTGNSLGFLERDDPGDRSYASPDSRTLACSLEKPDLPYLGNIGRIDHAATRVRSTDRDASILEFMELTNHTFQFAIYVAEHNSITTVVRRGKEDFAMVFTSGITPFTTEEASGPTERYIRHYGPRVHHIAFETAGIDKTFASLGRDGMEFLIPLVGSPEEGLKQTFSRPSPHTILVTEYIHRYGNFDGFFTKSNVTLLTGATVGQD